MNQKKENLKKRDGTQTIFLGKKIDALNNLYATLVDCNFTMNFYGNCSPSTLKEFKEKVQPKEEAYLRAKVMASIYLDNKADKIMSSALGAFRQASMAIWLSLPNDECPANVDSYSSNTKNINWSIFMDTYDKSVACLKDMLNPKILKSVEKPR